MDESELQGVPEDMRGFMSAVLDYLVGRAPLTVAVAAYQELTEAARLTDALMPPDPSSGIVSATSVPVFFVDEARLGAQERDRLAALASALGMES